MTEEGAAAEGRVEDSPTEEKSGEEKKDEEKEALEMSEGRRKAMHDLAMVDSLAQQALEDREVRPEAEVAHAAAASLDELRRLAGLPPVAEACGAIKPGSSSTVRCLLEQGHKGQHMAGSETWETTGWSDWKEGSPPEGQPAPAIFFVGVHPSVGHAVERAFGLAERFVRAVEKMATVQEHDVEYKHHRVK